MPPAGARRAGRLRLMYICGITEISNLVYKEICPKIGGNYRQNLQDVRAQASTEEHKQKVSLFIDNDIVPDPYYDDALFDPVFDLIHTHSLRLIGTLKG